MSNDKKHEEAVKEIVSCVDLKMNETNAYTMKATALFDKEKCISILKKHYDPELKAGYGDWILWNGYVLFLAKNWTHSVDLAIGIDGGEVHVNKQYRKPHIFVEKDLKLLNTDEVTYELCSIHLAGNYLWYVKITNSNNEGYYTIQPSSTKHLAIKHAFESVLGESLVRKLRE